MSNSPYTQYEYKPITTYGDYTMALVVPHKVSPPAVEAKEPERKDEMVVRPYRAKVIPIEKVRRY